MIKDDATSDLNQSDDKLFEPSLDMMVNDYDDESTLELEEKMASTEAQDPNAELNSLQRVSNTSPLPIRFYDTPFLLTGGRHAD